jgi:hypothetical protein
MLMVLRGEKSREVMVKPPGNFGRSRILEVDDCVFVAGKIALVEESAGAMDEAVVLVAGPGGDALAVKAREERSRAGPIEAFVVIKDANPQGLKPSMRRKIELPELSSINGFARCVKAGAEF